MKNSIFIAIFTINYMTQFPNQDIIQSVMIIINHTLNTFKSNRLTKS